MRKIFSSKLVSFLVVVAIILLLIFLNFKGLLEGPKNVVYKIFSTFQKIFYSVSNKISDFFSFFFSINRTIKENSLLKEQNVKLLIEVSQLKEIARENEVLREQLNLESSQKNRLSETKKMILANVLGQDPTSFGQYLFIDKGKKDNLTVNLPVTKAGGILIGKISEVSQSSSKVLLLTDQNSLVNVITQKNRATGILKGEAGLNLILEMIPQTEKIEKGELVLTSGLGGIFPKGLIIGEIEKIISSDIEVFKKAKVKPSFDIKDLEIVFVMSE